MHQEENDVPIVSNRHGSDHPNSPNLSRYWEGYPACIRFRSRGCRVSKNLGTDWEKDFMTRVTSNSWGLLAVPHEIVSRLGILLEVSRQIFTKVKFVVREGEEEEVEINYYEVSWVWKWQERSCDRSYMFCYTLFFLRAIYFIEVGLFFLKRNFKNLILLLFAVPSVDRCFSIFLFFNRIKRRIVFNWHYEINS